MSNGVLALVSQPNREMLRKSLARSHYKVSFISALSEVNSALVQFRARILIHDWQAVDQSQTRQFHLKFSTTSQAEGLIRILLVPEATPVILAFANDAMIDKVMTYGNAAINLDSEIAMLLSSQDTNELTKLIREAKNPGHRYSQQNIDEKITELYRLYPHDPKVKLEYGNLTYRQENFAESLQLAEELLVRDVNNLRAMNLKAKSLMKTGDFEQAAATLKDADLLSPSNPDRLLLLGDAFYGKGDLDKAVNYYEEAKALSPEQLNDANTRIGKVRIDQGRMEDALELFKNSASEEEAAGYFNNAAVIAVRDGKLKQAIALYYTALKSLKTNKLKPQIYFNIALTLRRLGMDDDAVKALNRSLHYEPGFEKAQTNLDELLKKKAKGKQAV